MKKGETFAGMAVMAIPILIKEEGPCVRNQYVDVLVMGRIK